MCRDTAVLERLSQKSIFKAYATMSKDIIGKFQFFIIAHCLQKKITEKVMVVKVS